MDLPAIVLPELGLPLNIVPILLHPSVVHFVIVLPIVILILELLNVMMRNRAIGGLSFFLGLLMLLATATAYFTGLADGKHAYEALDATARAELGEHKLLGIYILLGSALVLLFKLISMVIQRGIVKALYILLLMGLVAGVVMQGKEGGELTYEYGINVKNAVSSSKVVKDNKRTKIVTPSKNSGNKVVDSKKEVIVKSIVKPKPVATPMIDGKEDLREDTNQSMEEAIKSMGDGKALEVNASIIKALEKAEEELNTTIG